MYLKKDLIAVRRAFRLLGQQPRPFSKCARKARISGASNCSRHRAEGATFSFVLANSKRSWKAYAYVSQVLGLAILSTGSRSLRNAVIWDAIGIITHLHGQAVHRHWRYRSKGRELLRGTSRYSKCCSGRGKWTEPPCGARSHHAPPDKTPVLGWQMNDACHGYGGAVGLAACGIQAAGPPFGIRSEPPNELIFGRGWK